MVKKKKAEKLEIFTIGHSTHSLSDFLAILKKYDINQLIDIRKIPFSRHNPQFNKDTFAHYLRNKKIGYRNMVGLSGLRHTKKDSINKGLYNASFRGFADYMQTAPFKKNLNALIKIAKKKRVALMCAEILPFKCHRSLIADALSAHAIKVIHIYGVNSFKLHKMRSYAKVKDGIVYYPE